jgi:tetratricopeptide (TPR) repeat protein/predicted Ser/Thr protein kinase
MEVARPSLRELFEAARALPLQARSAWLDVHCSDPELRAQVQRLLDADAAPDAAWLQRRPDTWVASLVPDEAAPDPLQPGQRIGPFEIIAPLGEGGSARVFRARRDLEGVEQVVALKVLRHGLAADSARQQFDRERQVLTRLSHPQIARLIDAGISARGEAWIALEYCEGQPLLEHARALEPRQRIALMLRIARAVAAAHRALVVHRDLKPGNVLVTADGDIRLLDFGIAKMIAEGDRSEELAASTTRTGWRAFTPAYAAPEQRAGGVVTTATDVYALGLMLRELLAAGEKIARAPSGDLARVLAKATEEQPERRYEGAAAFADDLQRLLDGRPVHAHPPSRLYRIRRFVQRHRLPVALSAAALLGILVALAMALWQAELAQREANRARAVSGFLVDLFRAAEDRLPRHQRATPELLVAEARRALAEDREIDAATRAEIAYSLAEVSRLAARYAEAGELAQSARADLANIAADDPRLRRLDLLQARLLQHQGASREAATAAQALLAASSLEPELALQTLALLAEALRALGEVPPALDASTQRQRLAAQTHGAGHVQSLRAQLAHGVLLVESEQFREALSALDPALARWQAQSLALDRDYMAAADARVAALQGLSELDDALAQSQRLLEQQRGIYSEPHDVIALSLRNHAQILAAVGRGDEAVATHQRSIGMLREVLGPNHDSVVAGLTALAIVHAGAFRLEQAEAAYLEALRICADSASRSPSCARAQANFGMTRYRQGRFEEARIEIEGALARWQQIHGERHLNTAVANSMLANVAMAEGRNAEGVERSQQALAIMQAIGMSGSRDAALMRNSLAAALWREDRNDEALVEIDRSIADFDRLQPAQLARRTMMRVQRAQILRDLGRDEDARLAAEDALAMAAPPAELPPRTRQLLRELSGRAELFAELDPPAK